MSWSLKASSAETHDVPSVARGVHQLGQQPLPLGQRAPEALLLGPRPALDGRPLRAQLGVGVAHHLHGPLRQPREEALLDPEHAALVHRPAHDPAQDVPAVLVRGHHAVGQQEGGAAPVVGQDAQRAGGRLVLPVARPDSSSPSSTSGRSWSVSNTDSTPWRIAAMRSSPMPVSMFRLGSGVSEPSAPSSYCMKTRFQYSRKRSVSSPGPVLVGAELRTAVEVELRARAAGPGRARLPEVVLASEAHDPLVRDAHRAPALDRLLVRPQPELLVAAEDA